LCATAYRKAWFSIPQTSGRRVAMPRTLETRAMLPEEFRARGSAGRTPPPPKCFSTPILVTPGKSSAPTTAVTGSNFGLDTLKIPGTNGPDPMQGGIPAFQFNSTGWSNLGNASTGSPFLFRDNQWVSNGNFTWTKGKHQLRFGMEYNRSGINHF